MSLDDFFVKILMLVETHGRVLEEERIKVERRERDRLERERLLEEQENEYKRSLEEDRQRVNHPPSSYCTFSSIVPHFSSPCRSSFVSKRRRESWRRREFVRKQRRLPRSPHRILVFTFPYGLSILRLSFFLFCSFFRFLQDRLEKLKAALAPEPRPDCKEETCYLLFRLPGGAKLQRRFLSSATLQEVFDYLEIEGCPLDKGFSVQTNFPKRTISDLDQALTLKEANLAKQDTLFVQQA